MRYKPFKLTSELSVSAASERIRSLLSKEGVDYQASELSLVSIRIPIVVVGIQPKLYSKDNWVGINPFVFISGLSISFEPKGEESVINVRVDRLRALLWVAFWMACSVVAARKMPEPAGIFLVIGIAGAAWFGIVSFLGGYLIKKEIAHILDHRPK